MNTDQFFTACIRDPTNQLVAAECLALTGTSPAADGIALGGSIDAVAHAAYINYGARLLARGNSIDELAANIGRLDLDLDGFRLDIERIGHTPWAERRQTIVAVADALKNCYPNLSNPRHRIIVVERDEELLCGQILTQTDRSYRQHDDKPHRTSASLPSRLARALVNLVRPHADTVLNLCCGTGSILLEACATGLKASGCDSNPRMAGMSQKNVLHFDYDAEVLKADATQWPDPAAAIVTDLPYGRTLDITEAALRGILERACQVAPLAIFVAGEDLSDWLYQAGYSKVEIFEVPKYTGFTRYVHQASNH
jgi:tRNA G10  N-methylase Trm11